MGNIIDKLVWLFTGVFASHAGHYIYQTRYADKIAAISLTESIAILFEDVLQSGLYLLDKTLPLLVASRHMILAVVGLIVVMIIVFFGFKLYLKIKSDNTYALKVKEAENIIAEAGTQAEEQMEESRRLKENLISVFKKKEQVMQNNLEKKLIEYKTRIKKLELEKIELKETAAGLMRQLKAR